MNRRFLVMGAVGSTAVLILLILILVAFRQPRAVVQTSRYTERELLIPINRFLFRDLERTLLEPQIRAVADPAQPLDPALVEELTVDTRTEVQRVFMERAEDAIGDWLQE